MALSKKQFMLELVNKEDNSVKQEIPFDYSQMLFPKKPRAFKYLSDKMLVQEIEKFDMKITPSKALLSPLHRKALNPMRINIVGAK